MTIPLDESTRWAPPRDRWGRPLIIPPDGGKPQGYTRATTVAKTLDDEGALSAWSQRMTAAGLVRRPDLLALISTKLGPGGDIPQDAKRQVQQWCDEAKEAAAASAAANMGTALHALTELADLGAPLGTVPEAMLADLDAYRRTTAALEHLGVEEFVVLDDWQVAGTFDRLSRLPDGRLVIADLKTGADLSYSWRSICVQLAVYAHGVRYADGERTPLPADVDLSTAVVIHLPVGRAECTLHAVDIAAGWEAFTHSMWAREWRKRRDLAMPLSLGVVPHQAPSPTDALRARLAALTAEQAARVRAAVAVAGLPKLAECTPDQLEQYADAVADAMRETAGPWQPEEFTTSPPEAPTLPPEPRTTWQRPDDGGPLDEATNAAYERMVAGLADDVRAWVTERLGESVAVNRHIKVGARTVRTLEIVRAAVRLREATDDDDLVRHLLAAVLGTDMALQPAVSLGMCFGSLTIEQARTLAEAAERMAGGAAVLGFAEGGAPVLVAT